MIEASQADNSGASVTTHVSGSRRINQLDTLRGIAVSLVLLHHSFQAYHRSTADVSTGLSSWLDLGRLGVVIFFLISGFVIVNAMPGETFAAARLFWKHRFFRLYPAFWLSVLLAMITATIVGSSNCCVFSVSFDSASVMANLTMFPLRFHQPMLQGIYWTLELEMFFYMLMTIASLMHRANYRTMCGIAWCLFWAAMFEVMLRVKYQGTTEIGKDQLFLALLHLSLMFSGAALRYHWDNQTDRRTFFTNLPISMRFYLGIVLLFFVTVVAVKMRHNLEPRTFRVALTYLIAIGSFLACLRYMNGSAFGLFLGNRSFGIYLVHLPIVNLMALALSSRGWSYLSYLVVVCIFTLAAADLMRRMVERPAIAFAHRLRMPTSQDVAAT